MKRFCINAFAAVSGILCVSGCAGDVFNEPVGSDPTGELRVMTRSGDENTTPLAGASVYLFNSSGACASILTSDASGAYASAKLPAGSYTLYALGGDGLSSLVLPTQAEATPSSVLTLAENQSLGDLLMTQSTVALDDGESEDVSLTLERKVLEMTSVTINQVPDDITGVQVSVGALYGQVQLNGEYVASSSAPCVITLTSQGSGTWAATPQLITFPSKSKPVITITFTADGAEPRSYSYSSDEELLANHKYNLEGTYTEPLGVTINGTITAQAWDSSVTGIAFDFDESNSTNSSSSNDPSSGNGNSSGNDNPSSGTGDPSSGTGDPSQVPVAGETYKGCYVVSVNTEAHTAVLLSPTQQNGYNHNNFSESDWLNSLNEELKSWPNEEGVTGIFRIPTIEEIGIFAKISGAIVKAASYFGLNSSRLCTVRVGISGSVGNPEYSYGGGYYLRPVIDISY